MLDVKMTAGFKNVAEAHQVRIDVGPRLLNGVTDAGLRRKIDHSLGPIFLKDSLKPPSVLQGEPDIGKPASACQTRQTRLLERDLVIIIEVIDTNDFISPIQQSMRQRGTNETGGSGNENFHSI